MIRIVAVDMDGTLLSREGTISKVNKRAITLAKEKGVKVVLCSGRVIENLMEFAKELNIQEEDQYVVGYNGAGAARSSDGEFVFVDCLTGRETKEITKICDSVGANYTVHTFTKALTPRDNKHSRKETELNGVELIIEHPDCLSDEDVVTKVLILDDPEVLHEYEQKIYEALGEKYNVVKTSPIYLEIMRKHVNKHVGIMAVAKSLGIKNEEVLAIGDAMNDYEMIKEAGIGVAMGNAYNEVKKVADFVTKDHDENGVAYALNYFLKLGMNESN
jgi:Cof subfamily protein (haloacid dehalogenase superfamily)